MVKGVLILNQFVNSTCANVMLISSSIGMQIMEPQAINIRRHYCNSTLLPILAQKQFFWLHAYYVHIISGEKYPNRYTYYPHLRGREIKRGPMLNCLRHIWACKFFKAG